MSTPTTILVKSFNRPYYLDRCLRSIQDKIKGDYIVKVLDDGTPPAYLDKIKRDYPAVEIIVSDLYEEKVKQISAHVVGGSRFSLRVIPTKMWIDGVKHASDIFLMFEDDMWFIDELDINALTQVMRKDNIILTKLYWGSNPNAFSARIVPGPNAIDEYVPSIPTWPAPVLEALLMNKFKVASIAHRLGLIKEGIYFQLPFYDLYSVAAAVFNKQFWLHLWSEQQRKADETFQLLQAVRWYRMHKPRFAKSKKELTQTSFTTSATNTFADVDFDVFAFNHHLNEAWLHGRIDPMQEFPKDFKPQHIKPVLDAANDPRCTYDNWLRWAERFKAIYISMGCVVD